MTEAHPTPALVEMARCRIELALANNGDRAVSLHPDDARAVVAALAAAPTPPVGKEEGSEPVSDLSSADAGPLRPTPSWQPINPEARSGREVILCGKTSNIVCAGRFIPQEQRRPDWPMGCDWFFRGYGVEGNVLGMTAGLWMPLPAPPTDGAYSRHTQADAATGSEQKTTVGIEAEELDRIIDQAWTAGLAKIDPAVRELIAGPLGIMATEFVRVSRIPVAAGGGEGKQLDRLFIAGGEYVRADEALRQVTVLQSDLDAARERERTGWLPIVLCPTDGEWRVCLLPDGSEVVAAFEGDSLGRHARRWRKKEWVHHTPARPSRDVRGGVEQQTAPFDTYTISDLPEGVYPTHFRPNDTVYGRALSQPVTEGEGA